jgi:hypothetical protein
MLSAQQITDLQDERTRAWHVFEPGDADLLQWNASANQEAAAWLKLIASQHRTNFELWHTEDEARDPNATAAKLANVKRRVDSTNQLRNDLAEQLDTTLLEWLAVRGLPNHAAPLNSEPPGLIIDRLSILALKIYHTREEAQRANAAPGHAERNRERLAILEEQRGDLAACLDAVWQQTLDGTRRFKLYRQLKMYNDPSLNPAVYSKLVREPVR